MNGKTPNIKVCVKVFQENSVKNHNKVANGGGRCSGSARLTQLCCYLYLTFLAILFHSSCKISMQTDEMPRHESKINLGNINLFHFPL